MGMAIGMNGNTGVKTLTIKNRDGSTAGTITIHNSSLTKRKKLAYKQRRISTMIMQAKTSGNARQVLASAKTETVNLRRKLASGKYNDREVRMAIRHAERMERVAKKRMKHLQQEENIERHGNGMGQPGFDEEKLEEQNGDLEYFDLAELTAEEMKELMEEIQQEMEELASENDLEELVETVRMDLDPAELEQLKKKHRADELREIMEADLKYLKALFDHLEQERQEAVSPSGGVSLQLAGVEIPVQIDERSAAEVVSSGTSAMAAGAAIDISV